MKVTMKLKFKQIRNNMKAKAKTNPYENIESCVRHSSPEETSICCESLNQFWRVKYQIKRLQQ